MFTVVRVVFSPLGDPSIQMVLHFDLASPSCSEGRARICKCKAMLLKPASISFLIGEEEEEEKRKEVI